jgi:hypothetical protein
MLEIRKNDEQADPNDATGTNVPMAGEAGTELTEENLQDIADDPEADATDGVQAAPEGEVIEQGDPLLDE